MRRGKAVSPGFALCHRTPNGFGEGCGVLIWSAVAERSGDTAFLDRAQIVLVSVCRSCTLC